MDALQNTIQTPEIAQNTRDCAQALAVLGHETRLMIFQTLVTAEPAGLTAGDLAQRIGIQASNLSFHLKELKHVGLVNAERNGRYICLRANTAFFNTLMTQLMSSCCNGNPSDCGL